MLKLVFSARIQKDLKLMQKRRYDIAKFKLTVKLLAQNSNMPEQFRDHPLKGSWAGFRECHIEPDWLLIYRINDEESVLNLTRTGTHSDLFGR